MSVMDVLIGVGLVALALWQLRVTLRVWKSDAFERRQKLAQSQLIWLLPVLGATIVSMTLAQDEKPAQNRDDSSVRR